MSAEENGTALTALAAAITSEVKIAEEAAAIRGDATELTPAMFAQLWPLLRKPIPEGFIKSIGKVTGKPYDSTGISSVQVQHDRMNGVLSPAWWWEKVFYEQDGKLAHVRVGVGMYGEPPLYVREAWGGVDRASTVGNLYKGSYTNAAKLAFARVGPGHEVYLGATDLDPDVHQQAAEQQAPASVLPAGGVERALTDDERERVLAAIADSGESLPMLLAAAGAESVEKLTTAHAFELRKVLDERANVVAP